MARRTPPLIYRSVEEGLDQLGPVRCMGAMTAQTVGLTDIVAEVGRGHGLGRGMAGKADTPYILPQEGNIL